MVGAPPPLHPCPPRAPPTCPILYNIAPQAVLDPGIAPSASCLGHAPSLRLRAAHSCLALLGLCTGAGGRRRWRHPADRVLRGQGVPAALRQAFCGGIRGLGRSEGTCTCSSWARLASSQRALSAANALPLCPTRCLGHHHFPVLLFLLFRVMLRHSPPSVLHGSLSCSQRGRVVVVNSHLSPPSHPQLICS